MLTDDICRETPEDSSSQQAYGRGQADPLDLLVRILVLSFDQRLGDALQDNENLDIPLRPVDFERKTKHLTESAA